MATVGLDSVGDGYQYRPEADGERDVAPPVDSGMVSLDRLAESATGPQGSEDADGHVDPEHRPPVQGGEQGPGDQADEHPRQAGYLVDAEGEAALIVGEGVGEDGCRVGGEHRTAHRLENSPSDQPECPAALIERVEGKEQGAVPGRFVETLSAVV